MPADAPDAAGAGWPAALSPVQPARVLLSIGVHARKLWSLKVDAALHDPAAPLATWRQSVLGASAAASDAARLAHGCLCLLVDALPPPREAQTIAAPPAWCGQPGGFARVWAHARLELAMLLSTEAALLRYIEDRSPEGGGSAGGGVGGRSCGGQAAGGGGDVSRWPLALRLLRTGHHTSWQDALRQTAELLRPVTEQTEEAVAATAAAGAGVGAGSAVDRGEEDEEEDEKGQQDDTETEGHGLPVACRWAAHLLRGRALRELGEGGAGAWILELRRSVALSASLAGDRCALALQELGGALLDGLLESEPASAQLDAFLRDVKSSGVYSLAQCSEEDEEGEEEGVADSCCNGDYDYGNGGACGDGGGGGSGEGSAGVGGHLPEGAIAQATLAQGYAACESILVAALKTNPWLHRARLALARLHWHRHRRRPGRALKELRDLMPSRGRSGSMSFSIFQAKTA